MSNYESQDEYNSIRRIKLDGSIRWEISKLPERFRNISTVYDLSYEDYLSYINYAMSVCNFKNRKYTIHDFFSRYYTLKSGVSGPDGKDKICSVGVIGPGGVDYELHRFCDDEDYRIKLCETDIGLMVYFINLETDEKIDISGNL